MTTAFALSKTRKRSRPASPAIVIATPSKTADNDRLQHSRFTQGLEGIIRKDVNQGLRKSRGLSGGETRCLRSQIEADTGANENGRHDGQADRVRGRHHVEAQGFPADAPQFCDVLKRRCPACQRNEDKRNHKEFQTRKEDLPHDKEDAIDQEDSPCLTLGTPVPQPHP